MHLPAVVQAHVDSMRAILREKIAGDGGKIGRELLASLTQAITAFDVVIGKPVE